MIKKVLFFGAYDPDYSRNHVLLRGFNLHEIEVVHCNGETTGGIKKFLRLIWNYVRLTKKNFDVVLVPFPAQESTVVAGIIFLFRKWSSVVLISDMLTSHYEGKVLSRRTHHPYSLRAQWYWWLDKAALTIADRALVDSWASAHFLSREFRVPIGKMIVVPIGTDETVMRPIARSVPTKTFVVHFHGSVTPHQGVPTIIKAAHLLRNEDIVFRIIGRGQHYAQCRTMADELQLENILWIPPVSYEALAEYTNQADVCLGPMGGTGHFDLCIPNKLYEYMACAKPIIVGRSKAYDQIARDGKNMLLCNPTDEKDLVAKILALKHDSVLRENLGRNARQDFLEKYTPQILLANLLAEIKPGKAKIFLTGSQGFVGSRLVSFLRGKNYQVIEYVGDVRDAGAVQDQIKDSDTVIHLAALVDANDAGPSDFLDVNVMGTQNLVEICLRHHLRMLFFSSTTALRPIGLYGFSKSLCERLIEFHVRSRGLRAIVVRPDNLYDGDGFDRLGRKIDLTQGRHYPMAKLLLDLEQMIQDNPKTSYQIYSTRNLAQTSKYWLRRMKSLSQKIFT